MDTYETQATAKLSVALPDNPRAGIRPMEIILGGVCAALALSFWLNSGDLAVQIVRESYPASVVKNCERNTRVAVAALNGWVIETPEVRATCRVKQLKDKS